MNNAVHFPIEDLTTHSFTRVERRLLCSFVFIIHKAMLVEIIYCWQNSVSTSENRLSPRQI